MICHVQLEGVSRAISQISYLLTGEWLRSNTVLMLLQEGSILCNVWYIRVCHVFRLDVRKSLRVDHGCVWILSIVYGKVRVVISCGVVSESVQIRI